ncbi:hypothetical protein BDQ17DRAFT_1246323, partial [Cyathus striatus]
MLSPFQQHLGTNYVPSIEELDDINSIVAVSSEEVHTIDIEINQLQHRLHLLQERRSEVCDFLDRHRALVSPFRRISRDVLEEIFLACLPTVRNPCITAIEAPLLLTHVCSSWRSVAHTLPQLWSAIHIALPTFSERVFTIERSNFKFQEELLRQKLNQLQGAAKEWLHRTGGCQLSISVFRTPVERDLSDRAPFVAAREQQLHTSFLSAIVVPYSNRW